jgi:hypothetical protein
MAIAAWETDRSAAFSTSSILLEIASGVNQLSNFLQARDLRQPALLLRIG